MKAGFIGIIGQPNAGKSSLVNVLVKEKVSIVTEKPQTTRRRVLGILNSPEAQFVFVDSPGLLRADKGLNGFLALEARDVMESSDLVLGVLSLDESKAESLQNVLDLLKEAKKPVVVVIHKIDLTDLSRRISRIRDMVEKTLPGTEIFELSSLKPDLQIQEKLLATLMKHLPESPAPLYDIELFTPHSSRELVAEFVRESCFEVLHQEVPDNLAVQVQKFDEQDPHLLRIWADIWVSREGHKPIVIGKKGANLKEIGTQARKGIEKMLGTKVFLSLNVTVKEDWSFNPRKMRDLGYVIEKD